MGERDTSLSLMRQALEIARIVAPASQEVGVTLNNIGRICEAGGMLSEAINHYSESIETLRKVARESKTLALALGNMGGILHGQHEWTRAIEFLTESARVVERLRSRGGGERARESLFSQIEMQLPYVTLISHFSTEIKWVIERKHSIMPSDRARGICWT